MVVVAKYLEFLGETGCYHIVASFNVNYTLKYEFRISGSQGLNWQLINSEEFKVPVLDTEPKFSLAKRVKAYNYGQKCNNKSTVTTCFPPHISSGIYLNIQLTKTRRDGNFTRSSNAVSIQSRLSYDLFFIFPMCISERFLSFLFPKWTKETNS